VKNGKEVLYKVQKDARGRTEYVSGNKHWARSDADGVMQAIIVEDADGQKFRFEAEMNEGKFKAAPGQPVRYVEVDGKGRVMTDDYIGRVSIPHHGKDFANLFLNFLHIGVWFACLWLIMRFQWSHALGFALVLWLAVTLTVLPMLLRTTEQAARQKTATITLVQPDARICMMSPSCTM
jgi:hypothetical protein